MLCVICKSKFQGELIILHKFKEAGTGTYVSSSVMATLHAISAHRPSSLTKSITDSKNSHTLHLSTSSSQFFLNKLNPSPNSTFLKKKLNWVISSVAEDQDLAPPQTSGSKLHQDEDLPRLFLDGSENSEGLSSSSSSSSSSSDSSHRKGDDYDFDRLRSRTINATIVLAVGTLAITRLLTIDHDYWQVSEE